MTGAELAASDTAPDTHLAIPDEIPAGIPPAWNAAFRLSKRIAGTSFVPKGLRDDPNSVLAAILYGLELGMGPMQALRSINVIEGRPSLSAETMRALVHRAGHRISVVEARQDRVTLYGRRRDTGAEAKVTWTLQDATRAKLTGNPAWGKYPRSMLLARATSELVRMLFSDAVAGLSYTPEETAAIEGIDYEPAESELVDPVTARNVGALETEPDEGLETEPEEPEDPEDQAWVADAKGDAG